MIQGTACTLTWATLNDLNRQITDQSDLAFFDQAERRQLKCVLIEERLHHSYGVTGVDNGKFHRDLITTMIDCYIIATIHYSSGLLGKPC